MELVNAYCKIRWTEQHVIIIGKRFVPLGCRRNTHAKVTLVYGKYTRWFKYDRDDLCVNKSQFVPVIFEPPCRMLDLKPARLLDFSVQGGLF